MRTSSKEKYLCDRMTSAAKVLASGASMIIGTSVQETVQLKLSEIAFPEKIKSMVSTFCGTLATGLLTVSFLFYIDNDPFKRFIDRIYGSMADELQRQGVLFKEYCAELKLLDMKEFCDATEYAYDLSINIQSAANDTEVNQLLRKAQIDLGLEPLWDSLDTCMKNPEWKLHFR